MTHQPSKQPNSRWKALRIGAAVVLNLAIVLSAVYIMYQILDHFNPETLDKKTDEELNREAKEITQKNMEQFKNAYIITDNNHLQIQNSNGKAVVRGNVVEGGLNLWAFYDEMDDDWDTSASTSLNILLDDYDDRYYVNTLDESDLGIKVQYDDSAYLIAGSDESTSSFKHDSGASLENNEGEFSITLIYNEDDGFGNKINVRGEDQDSISVEKTDDGFYVSTSDDNLDGVTISVTKGGETSETVLETKDDNVVVKADEPGDITIIEPQHESIATADISGLVNKTYTGSEITQTPVVTYSGTVLTEGTDYTVSYSDNIKAGTATVTITGTGNYTGTVTKTFMILPGKTTRGDMFNLANNVKVTWKEVPGAKYYKVYREGITDKKESRDEPVIVTERLIGWDAQPGLTNGHAYRYKIVASLTGKGDSSGDSTRSYSKVMYRLKTVVIRSVKNTAPGKVTVKYDKTTSGDSYVLQYCERQDMVGAKTKVVLGAMNTSYVIGGLKKGKTYYISIRVRKKVNGIDYYPTFGVPKKIKITK